MIIETKNFKLAAIANGDKNSPKVALVLPGRLDSKDYAHNVALVSFLATKGYYALSIDPPGTRESPGGLEIYTTTNYLRAIAEIIDLLGNRPTLLLGHSRGGSVSFLSSDNPAVIGAVGIMANYGAPTPPTPEGEKMGYQVSYRRIPSENEESNKRKEFNLPLNYFRDGEKYDIQTALIASKKPKLLIYGTRDEFTDPQEVKSLYEVIPESKMIYEIDSEHEYLCSPKIIEEVNDVIDDFLTTYHLAS